MLNKLKQSVKYSIILLKQNLLLNLFFCFQTIFVLLLITVSLYYFSSINLEEKYAKRLSLNNGVVIYNSDKIDTVIYKNIDKEIRHKSIMVKAVNQYYNLNLYDKYIVDLLKIPLKKGRYFNNTTNEIEAVVDSSMNYKINDIVDINSADNKKFKIKVVGILPLNYTLVNFRSASRLDIKKIFSKNELKYKNIFISNKFMSIFEKSNKTDNDLRYINFKNISRPKVNNLLKHNSNKLNYVFVDSIISNSKYENQSLRRLITPILIVVISTIFITLFISSYFLINSYKLNLSILYLHGASINDIILILFQTLNLIFTIGIAIFITIIKILEVKNLILFNIDKLIFLVPFSLYLLFSLLFLKLSEKIWKNKNIILELNKEY